MSLNARDDPATAMRCRRGLTLLELITALVLTGIVGTAVLHVLVAGRRLHRSQAQRAEVQASARTAIALIPMETRELDAAGGDIIAMTATSLAYKSMTGVFVLCASPDTGARRLTLAADGPLGLQPIHAATDSILLLSEQDAATRPGDMWLHADVTGVKAGTACPGGAPSIDVDVTGVTSADLAMVTAGSPVRTFQPTELRLYQDGTGAWWLGAREYAKGPGTWSVTQPIVGPLSASGLMLAYADSTGAATTSPRAVYRIGVAVESRSPLPVRGGGAGAAYRHLYQALATAVAVRNSPLD